jgi:hypothetical protein
VKKKSGELKKELIEVLSEKKGVLISFVGDIKSIITKKRLTYS